MSLGGFWAAIDAQLKELESAKSADDVMRILDNGKGGAFFGGGGGDSTPMEPLLTAGWRITWSEASYYWEMRAPDGSYITYIEGDVYKGRRDAAQ